MQCNTQYKPIKFLYINTQINTILQFSNRHLPYCQPAILKFNIDLNFLFVYKLLFNELTYNVTQSHKLRPIDQTRFFRRDKVSAGSVRTSPRTLSSKEARTNTLCRYSASIFFPTLLRKIGVKSGKVRQKGGKNVIQKKRAGGGEKEEEEEETREHKRMKKEKEEGDEVLRRLSGVSNDDCNVYIPLLDGWRSWRRMPRDGVICTQKREANVGTRIHGGGEKRRRRGEKSGGTCLYLSA